MVKIEGAENIIETSEEEARVKHGGPPNEQEKNWPISSGTRERLCAI
jgi:hypothetical protein